MTVTLKRNTDEGEKPSVSTIYLLPKFELKTLREFIDDNLKTRFIHPSNSFFGALVLFVKKKDGAL
jgi:hypothetical protein